MGPLTGASPDGSGPGRALRAARGSRTRGALLAAAALAALLLARSGALGLPRGEAQAGALVLVAVAGWALGRMPEHLVALAFFTLGMLFEVAPASVIFSGFASGALWLIFGGQAIGIAIRESGLARRLADAAAHRLGSRSYLRILAGTAALGILLGMVMPSSTGRVVLLMPVALALADGYGFRPGTNGRTGILLAAAFGTYVPSLAVLPANVPNAVLAGAAESQYGVFLGYAEYLILHFPVLGLARAAVIVGLVALLWPDRVVPRVAPRERPPPLSRREKAVIALLAVCLGLWATDFLHRIPPAWISLAAGLLVLLPWSRLSPEGAFGQQISYASLFFVAGVLGVGALLSYSGLGTRLAHGVQLALPFSPGADLRNVAALAAMGAVLNLATTSPGLPAVMTPLAGSLAQATGLPLKTVLMAEVLGYSNNLLPYQSPPLVVATQITDLAPRSVLKLTLALAAATTLVLLPVDLLWWRALGWLR